MTWIAAEGKSILGFATIVASEIEIEDLPKTTKKRISPYPLPILRLARLAVHQDARESGVGKMLLRAVFLQAHEMAKRYGCIGVVVDAKPEAVEYYKKLGFDFLEVTEGCLQDRPQPIPMFIPLGKIPRPTER